MFTLTNSDSADTCPCAAMRHRAFLMTLPACLLLLCLAQTGRAYTYPVSTLNDDGPGSLRRAIKGANANPGPDTIVFKSGLSGTIRLASALPAISGDLTIAGPTDRPIVIARSAANNTPYFRILTISNGTASGPVVSLSNITLANGLLVNDSGGGILNDRGMLTLANCTLVNNAISAGDGGIGTYLPAIYGGGIYNNHGTLAMTNCTLSGNMAGSVVLGNIGSDEIINFAYGDGISNAGTLNMAHCTLGRNVLDSMPASPFAVGPYGEGIYNATGAKATLTHTLLASSFLATNHKAILVNYYGDGTLISAGYNQSDDHTGPASTTDRLDANIRLGPLAYNGGPTPTRLPLRGGSAIDAGDPDFDGPPFTDQRGLLRLVGRVDVGATERQDGEYVAYGVAFITNLGVALTVDAPGILQNGDQSAPDDLLLIEPKSWVTHGQLKLTSDGSFVYTPAPGYVGVDSFTYQLRNLAGIYSNIATVTITIKP